VIAWVGAAMAGTWELARARRVEGEALPPAPAERVAYAALVRDLARAAPAGAVPPDGAARAEALGLVLTVADGVAVLAEPEDRTRGAGVVAVRLGPLGGELVLQAPHPVSDLHTGRIAGALFDAGEARAACFATTHRADGEGADPAHTPESWLSAATLGLADALPEPLFVQVHGFGEARSEADAVVSEGAARARPGEVEAAAKALAVGLGVSDVRTGAEVPALAARTNAQSRLLDGRARFLHVELSAGVRERLREDASGLGDVLVGLAE
jgi:hypothetical protein